jgi:scyllo-inositol 2-dehydrogenase (NADP+)
MLKEGQMPGAAGWGKEDPDYWGVLNAEMHGQQFYGTIETEPGNYMGFYDNVYEVITRGAELAVKPEEARNVIRIIELAFDSNKKGAIVKLV